MKQYVDVSDLKSLSAQAQDRLETWFTESIEWDDDPVYVYIPQEEIDGHDGRFKGTWDSEREFRYNYHEPYTGKIKHHEGTVLPILDIMQMMAFLNEYDNDDLAFRLHLLTHAGTTETANTWSFDSNALCNLLWQAVKTILEKDERTHP